MGLVNELQQIAAQDDLVDVVRKAKRLSAKLGRNDIAEWLSHEQNGYSDGNALPAYRRVRVTLCYNTNGYVPAGHGFVASGIAPLPELGLNLDLPIGEPINTVAKWIKSLDGKKGIYMPLAPELAEQLRDMLKSNSPSVLEQITFLARLSDDDLSNILEQVRNKILDWACDLETTGISGESGSFSEQEKTTAQTVIVNIFGSAIEQLNTSGSNLKLES